MYKWCTSVLLILMRKHDDRFGIMQRDQRGAKINSWGCPENLAVDRMVMEDARLHQRTLMVGWVDYKKAYDSVPHRWISVILRIFRFPMAIQRFVSAVMGTWKTRFVLQGEKKPVITEVIQYLTGIFQGDGLCPYLFCLAVNPLSWRLRSFDGYVPGDRRKQKGQVKRKVTHLYYIDDLKLFAMSESAGHFMMMEVKRCSLDMGLEMGFDKCAMALSKAGKVVEIEDLPLGGDSVVHALNEGETYKFLGVEENAGFARAETVRMATFAEEQRLHLIWRSDLSALYKVRASNSFAVPKANYAMWAVRWNVDERSALDSLLRKIMVENMACHPQMAKAILFLSRKLGGRGLRSHELVYQASRIQMAIHLAVTKDSTVRLVAEHEDGKEHASLFREAEGFAREIGLTLKLSGEGAQAEYRAQGELVEVKVEDPKAVKRVVHELQQMKLLEEARKLEWQGTYLERFYAEGSRSKPMTFAWLKWENMPVEVEVGMFELLANLLKTRVFDDIRDLPVVTRKCRVCGAEDETVRHLAAGCKPWSFTYYKSRHDGGLRPLCWWLRFNYGLDAEMKPWYAPETPDPVSENERICIWWDVPVFTDVKLEHNRVDMRVWLKKEKKLFTVEMSTPWDENMDRQLQEKVSRYRGLAAELAAEYRGRVEEVIQMSLIVGALGTIESLEEELAKMIVNKREVRVVGERMQRATVTGTLRTFNKFKMICCAGGAP